jgi:predicted GNAT family N-acyltransferase
MRLSKQSQHLFSGALATQENNCWNCESSFIMEACQQLTAFCLSWSFVKCFNVFNNHFSEPNFSFKISVEDLQLGDGGTG